MSDTALIATRELRCNSCGRLIGHVRPTRAVVAYCLDPVCPYLPPLGSNDTRDSAMFAMTCAGWAKQHVADAFGVSRQRIVQVVGIRRGEV